jgi:glycosyltransferase involved in cell wall biosynthesis
MVLTAAGRGTDAAPSPRVLQVVLSLNPGGTERLVLQLIERLHSRVPMAVCCIDEKGAWAGQLEPLGIAVTALVRRPGFQVSLGSAIARLVRQHRANVIHSHHYSPFIYSCLSRIWAPRTRIVFTEHGRLSDAKPSRKRKIVNRVAGRLPDAAFAVSAELREHLVAEGFPARAMGVIHNGIEVARRPDATLRHRARVLMGAGDEVLVVGTIARLDPVKDLPTLLRAFAALHLSRRARLVVVGDGAEREHLHAIARQLGVTDRVHFAGHRNDAREWLAGFDIFVNSSISEGISLTILEAMAAALPVVATRVGGTGEVIDPSCGRLVASRDPAMLAQAIDELAADASLRRQMGDAGHDRVERHFSLDRMVAAYDAVYQRVL